MLLFRAINSLFHRFFFIEAHISSFINVSQYSKENINAFAFEKFSIGWHTVINDFFAFLHTQTKYFRLFTIPRCCLKRNDFKMNGFINYYILKLRVWISGILV